MKLTAEKLKKLIKEEMDDMKIPDDAHAGHAEHNLRTALKTAQKEGMSKKEILKIVDECCGK